MSSVARGGGTNHRRADNKETRSNWIMVGAAILRLGVEWPGLSFGQSVWSVWSVSGPSPRSGHPFDRMDGNKRKRHTGRGTGWKEGRAGLCIP